jgi:uncharacterized membrane protein YobD (UPF0266 family)
MSLENFEIADLPFNTLTVYFAPILFYETPIETSFTDMRILTSVEFFNSQGYLRENIPIATVLQKLYLITSTNSFYNALFLLHTQIGEIIFAENDITLFKLNTKSLNLSIGSLTDMQNVINLKTSALSRHTKKIIQKFWQKNNQISLLKRVTDEMYPTQYVKTKLAYRLGLDPQVLLEMDNITEAIKAKYDAVEEILKLYNIEPSKILNT